MLSLSRSLGAFRDSEEGSRIIKHPGSYAQLTAEKCTVHRQKGQGLCCRRNLSQTRHCKRIEKWTTGKSAMHRSIGILNCSLRAVRSKFWRSFCFGAFPNIAHPLAKYNSRLQNLHLIQPKEYRNFWFLKNWKTGSSGKQSLFRGACLRYLFFEN